MAGLQRELTVCNMLIPKVTCLSTLPSAHGARGQSRALAAAPRR
jgi:hypothetical protein